MTPLEINAVYVPCMPENNAYQLTKPTNKRSMFAGRSRMRASLALFALLGGCGFTEEPGKTAPGELPDNICFKRHVIEALDDSADGVHVGDINHDGLPDVVSGWEKSGQLKVYFHPGVSRLASDKPWQSVDIRGGEPVPNIGDAAFADMDGDGTLDAVLSSSEGKGESLGDRRVRVHHWDNSKPITKPSSWTTSGIFRDEPTDRFTRVRAAQMDGVSGVDIVALSRDLYEENAKQEAPSTSGSVSLFISPSHNSISTPNQWQRKTLAEVEKGKALELIDLDGDGLRDILYASNRQIAWLKNPGPSPDGDWSNQVIGAASDFALCDINGDGKQDIVATAGRKDFPIVARWFEPIRGTENDAIRWRHRDISIGGKLSSRFYQLENFALKSIACGNFRPNTEASMYKDIIITTSGSGFGIFLVVAPATYADDETQDWAALPLTEYKWITKYDDIIATDLDQDGDTDFVTSAEDDGLLFQGAGVLWFENQPCL